MKLPLHPLLKGFTPREYQPYYMERIENTPLSISLLKSLTGTGKTKTFFLTALTALKDKRILFVTPRIQLTREVFKEADTRMKDFGILQGSTFKRPKARILLCTIDTLANRLKKGQIKNNYDYIFFDECHIKEELQREIVSLLPTTCKVIGMSATPYNSNGSPLKLYENAYIINEKYSDIEYFLNKGFLVDIEYIVAGELSTEQLKQLIKGKDGEYTSKSVDELVDGTEVDIVEQTKRLIVGQTVVFARSISHADALVLAYQREGFKTIALHSEMKERMKGELKKGENYADKILNSIRNFENQIIVSVDMIKFGIDIPCLETCIKACPTNSSSNSRQEWGRGIRPYTFKDGRIKTSCRAIDCYNNIERVGHPFNEPTYDEDSGNKRKSSKMVCEECESSDIELVDEFIDESFLIKVRKYDCRTCGHCTVKKNALDAFKCEECNRFIRETPKNRTIRKSKIFGVCPKGHETEIGHTVPREMVVTFRNRENAFNIIKNGIDKREMGNDIKRDFLTAIDKNSRVLSDKLLGALINYSSNLQGNYSTNTIIKATKLVNSFSIFTKLRVEDTLIATVARRIKTEFPENTHSQVVARLNNKIKGWENREMKKKKEQLIDSYLNWLKKQWKL